MARCNFRAHWHKVLLLNKWDHYLLVIVLVQYALLLTFESFNEGLEILSVLHFDCNLLCLLLFTRSGVACIVLAARGIMIQSRSLARIEYSYVFRKHRRHGSRTFLNLGCF